MESFIEEKEDCACYAGQPIDNSKEDLLEALKKAFLAMANERADKLIEKSPEDYICGTSDCGYYHNGVGFASCGATENEYDEDKAFEDAKEEIISELVNNEEDAPYYLFENNEFTIALGKFLTVL